MRYQGKISGWKDDQGFGFVNPNGCGQKAFVHIKAFLKHSSRPIEGDLITYELTKDERNRFCAKNIKFVGESLTAKKHYKTNPIPVCLAILFLSSQSVLVLIQDIPLIMLQFYLVASAITFVVYAIDKSAAESNNWRTKESSLHLFSLIGGWPGAIFAQKILRHKSKKEEFQIVFWGTVILNCSAMAWLLLSNNGREFLNSMI